MLSSLLGFAILSLSLSYATVASSHQGQGVGAHRRHEAIVAAHNNATDAVEHAIHRRGQTFNNARLTFYDVGLGACGKNNAPSDYIVALNSPQYGGGYPGPNCFKRIEITCNGKTIPATIMDECPGCPYGGLDLSEGLFSAFASLDEGVLTASWRFADGSDDSGSNDDKPTTTEKPTPKPTPTTTTHKAEPTTTKEPEPKPEPSTTSTKAAPTTISLVKLISSSSSFSSSTPSSTSHSATSTSSVAPSSSSVVVSSSSAVPTPTSANTLGKLNQAFVGLAELVVAAAQAA